MVCFGLSGSLLSGWGSEAPASAFPEAGRYTAVRLVIGWCGCGAAGSAAAAAIAMLFGGYGLTILVSGAGVVSGAGACSLFRHLGNHHWLGDRMHVCSWCMLCVAISAVECKPSMTSY